ncbi:variable surface protein [Plasmodium gonderi]|uniref:Variable surface protein n=1 Tax=Plasmodium gonderi TaxID=77519 RepID=A0A1Y1JSZ5_PLAGO|nr:variable surface protein [Plasmodium gonderi]GAW84575.1 variable surface protein [Plasmodium gonderi]
MLEIEHGNIISISKCEKLLDESIIGDTCLDVYDSSPTEGQPEIEKFYRENYCTIFSYLKKINYHRNEYNISIEAALIYLYYWIYIKHTNHARTYKIYDVFKAFLNGYEALYKTEEYKAYINKVISNHQLKKLESIFDVYICLNKKMDDEEKRYCDTLKNIIDQYNTEIESKRSKMESTNIQAYNRSYNAASIIITVVIMMFSSYGSCIRRRINNIRKIWIHKDKEWNILQSPESFDSNSWNYNYNVI